MAIGLPGPNYARDGVDTLATHDNFVNHTLIHGIYKAAQVGLTL